VNHAAAVQRGAHAGLRWKSSAAECPAIQRMRESLTMFLAPVTMPGIALKMLDSIGGQTDRSQTAGVKRPGSAIPTTASTPIRASCSISSG
jgi:hypothetical protein